MKIAVYTICKNEKENVIEWLESMNEADYICVLDTGSTDGTYELLLEQQNFFPQLIVKQKQYETWRFDVARNDSMQLIPSDTDVCICTDLDERLIANWYIELKRVAQDLVTPYQISYLYAWSHNPDRIFWYNKIHNYGDEWSWQFPVHEALVCSKPNLQTKQLDPSIVWLHHYPDSTKSRANYLPLLEQRAQENPNDWFGKVYLAHEYFYHNLYERCLNYIMEIWREIPLTDDWFCRTDLMMFAGKCNMILNRNSDAECCFLNGVSIEPLFLDNYLCLAELYNEQKEYEKAVKILHKALLQSKRLYSWLETAESWNGKLYDLLSIAYFYIGNYDASLNAAKTALVLSPQDKRIQDNITIIESYLHL